MLDRLTDWLRPAVHETQRELTFIDDPSLATGLDQRATDVDASSIIQASVLWAVRAFSEARLVVRQYDDGGVSEELPAHPLSVLLDDPNPNYSSADLFGAMVYAFLTRGKTYVRKMRRDGLLPTELMWMPPGWCAPVRVGDDYVSYYRVRGYGGQIEDVMPEDIIYMRQMPSMGHPLYAADPIAAVTGEIDVDTEAQKRSKRVLKNSLGLAGAIMPDDEGAQITEESLRRSEARINQRYSGENVNRWVVLNGKTKVQTLMDEPNFDLSQGRRVPEERIGGVVGVNAIVANLGAGLEHSTYSNFESAHEAAYEGCIMYIQRVFGRELTRQLASDFGGGVVVEWDNTDVRVLAADQQRKTQRIQSLVLSGIMTTDEARAELGLPELEEPEVEDEPDEEEEGERALKSQNFGDLTETRALQLPGSMDTWQRMMSQTLTEWGKRVAAHVDADLLSAPGDIEQMVDRLLGYQDVRVVIDGGMPYAWMVSYMSSIFDGSRKATASDERAMALVNEPAARAFIRETRSYWKAAMEVEDTRNLPPEAWSAIAALSGDGPIPTTLRAAFMIPDVLMHETLRKGGIRKGLVDFTATAKRNLFSILTEARQEGLGARDVARRIRGSIGAGRFRDVNTRALVIARTESRYSTLVGSMSNYQASGASGLEAIDNQIGFDDEDCIERNGTVYSFAEADILNEVEHPNGTLDFVAVWE